MTQTSLKNDSAPRLS